MRGSLVLAALLCSLHIFWLVLNCCVFTLLSLCFICHEDISPPPNIIWDNHFVCMSGYESIVHFVRHFCNTLYMSCKIDIYSHNSAYLEYARYIDTFIVSRLRICLHISALSSGTAVIRLWFHSPGKISCILNLHHWHVWSWYWCSTTVQWLYWS